MKDIVFKTVMLKGEGGTTIDRIEKTSSSLNVDTYTIYFNDDKAPETFEVTNGTSIESIEKTATSGLVDTYTITLTDESTYTFEVQNGEDAALYEVPTNGVIAFDGNGALPQGYEEVSSWYDTTLNPSSTNAVEAQAIATAINNVDSREYKAGDDFGKTQGVDCICYGRVLFGGTTLSILIPTPEIAQKVATTQTVELDIDSINACYIMTPNGRVEEPSFGLGSDNCSISIVYTKYNGFELRLTKANSGTWKYDGTSTTIPDNTLFVGDISLNGEIVAHS